MALKPDEAEFVLRGIIAREQQRLQTILAPYVAALVDIEARKEPQPVQLPDGRVAVYSGPTAEYAFGPYRAPRWLESMCGNIGTEMDDLRRYRERLDAE